MYNGPPLPPERELPLSLLVEFLMAAGAGRDDQEFLSLPWTDTELQQARVASRQGIRDFLEEGTAGSTFAGGLFTALTDNEDPAILDQLKLAQKTWVAASPTERRQRVKDAVASYGLPETWQTRRSVFSQWARRLREKPYKLQLALHDLSMIGFADARSPYRLVKGFKKFLDQDALPYFSRDYYMEDMGAQGEVFSETDLIRKIDEADETRAILIHGPGGHGKTRLAHQLCKATKADLALLIEPLAADYLKLKDYLKGFREGRREPAALRHVLLFQDYAENVRTATPVRSFCDVVRNDLDIRTTLILCSRSSGVRLVEQTYDDFEIDAYSVGVQKDNGTTYEHWLVAQILKHFDLDNDAGLVALTRDLPFLAAFAGFLKTEHPSLFDKQFRISVDNQHFAAWARKRADSLAGLESTARRRLAEIALALPVAKAEVDHITEDRNEVGTKIFEALEGDFWIEEEADTYAPVHDAFADALVTQHLFGTEKPANRMAELLSTACEKEYFGRALHALGRVSGAEELEVIDPVSVLAKLEKKHALAIQQNALEVVSSALVPTQRLPSVLNAIDSLYEGLRGDLEACRFLSHSVASLRKRERATEAETCPRLDDLLKSISFDSDLRIISNLVWHDPGSYRESATALMLKSADDWDVSYLIGAVLANGGSLQRVGPSVLRWLQRFSTASATAFVLVAWFEAVKEQAQEADSAGTPVNIVSGKVANYLAPWCLLHGRKYFAAKVLAAWASESRGSTQAMSALDDWLDLYADRFMATHVLQTALKLGRSLDAKFQDYVKRWLSENSRLSPVATLYLFRELRDAGVSWRAFSSEALAFIGSDLPPKAHRDMCIYWLQMGGDADSIRGPLRSAVDLDPLDEHVRFVFQTWELAAPRDMGFWASNMVLWLRGHFAHPRAAYVFNLWYKHKLGVAAVRAPLIAWLKHNGSDHQYPVVLSNHYRQETASNPEVFPFAELALFWLKTHAGHPHSSFLFLAWIHRRQDLTTIRLALRTWLGQNDEHPAFPGLLATYALDPASLEEIGVSEDRARAFLKRKRFSKADCRLIEFILSSPFGSNPQSEIGRTAIEGAQDYLQEFGSDIGSAFLIAKVIRLIGAEGWIIAVAATWLESFSLRHRANLVLQALLTVNPRASTYEAQVRSWLTQNQEYIFAGALLLEWARAGGDVMLFQRQAAAWIDTAHAQDDFPDVDEVERLYWQANIQMSRDQG
ncbi:hypothetical protein FJ414_28220 [Mesorhizobium sp. B3-1-6]|uniref:hypothetical protein n=1 Tax=Mesorhizobium sp. B3-1-6 TaxID=2589895 RepID=UPI001125F244|nr:hypothetical protein [Mesorhizobium sp. B3-1-6]TPI27875.1 hypothetical protein FJ414_28220 [Mesorhizobium sp. B3-1-6]